MVDVHGLVINSVLYLTSATNHRQRHELHVDADMRYDPATETSTGYLHGMERVIEKILERARDDSPVFWTNVHRYVPSDSAWCENLQASPTPTTTSRANIYTPTTINNITLQPDIIYSQQLNETVFVGHVTSHCLCNWHNGVACVVPKCYEVAVSAELNARWQELCTRGTYTSRVDLLLFMQVLDETSVFDTAWLDAPPAPLLRCDALLPSTSWGLLDTKLHADWYNQTENTQHISIHELATSGPAGLRLGLLSEGPNSLHDFVTKHKLTSRSPDAKMVNYQYQHTIAQPHCHNQRQQFLHANLSLYFRDVFFPMAHSIHEAPITSYCSTWAIEYAMEQTLKQILPFNDNTLVEQQERTSKWKTRCDVQLQQMGICLLRGVYDIVPHCECDTDNSNTVANYRLLAHNGAYRVEGESIDNPTLQVTRGQETVITWPNTTEQRNSSIFCIRKSRSRFTSDGIGYC